MDKIYDWLLRILEKRKREVIRLRWQRLQLEKKVQQRNLQK